MPSNSSTPELDWTKISNGKPPRNKDNNDYKKGFALYPAGFQADGKTPAASVNLQSNMTLQSQNNPVQISKEPKKK